MAACSKRYRRLLIPVNDEEFFLLESLVASHTIDDKKPSKSFIVRYGLKRLADSLNPAP